MALDRTTILFFDAAALFAASHSPNGGSAYLVLVCAKAYLNAVVSPDVLLEAERNIVAKSTAAALSRYRYLIASTPLRLVEAPSELLVRRYSGAFFEDAHVVASALAARAEYLITLDRRLERRIEESDLPLVCISPKAFIQDVLPDHPDHDRMRGTAT